MKHRLLTGLAVAPWAFAVLPAGPAAAAAPAAVSEPAKQSADAIGMLAGSMVVGAGAAFAGTAAVRRRR